MTISARPCSSHRAPASTSVIIDSWVLDLVASFNQRNRSVVGTNACHDGREAQPRDSASASGQFVRRFQQHASRSSSMRPTFVNFVMAGTVKQHHIQFFLQFLHGVEGLKHTPSSSAAAAKLPRRSIVSITRERFQRYALFRHCLFISSGI